MQSIIWHVVNSLYRSAFYVKCLYRRDSTGILDEINPELTDFFLFISFIPDKDKTISSM